MDQEAQEAQLIVHLSEAFNKDEVWQLAAAEALSKATNLERVLIRGSTAAKQLKLVDVLIRKTSAAGLGAGSAAGAGAAAGPGPGSTAADGLPACKLQLRQDSQNQDLFFFEPMDTVSAAAATSAGVNSMFFLDPKGRQIAELKKWLDLAEDEYCMGRPIRPLFINGLVKVGYNGLTKDGELLVQLVSNPHEQGWRFCQSPNTSTSSLGSAHKH
ncbi:hypothetical protein VOLCADRAFT_107155 [Volvox carteri f. nagariensis]|uniref:Uncharacterized protein n=1 Tax=Volvox carteri f. nagariensis TaxID=3068 RepID=D8UC84_VOLCA|nr:uncharacterized protein VOLCADRAFT_107155 [Volvox carteri f. nagariensis]EFJ42654.1 hypothetical protein VOLCADRAFT_107155 [Volvox carteri f. nagariensis]|eukprot:XP_002956305.1 hypothetical protein VOLCADRAFT_107155 [Volvox carteri f. nagariensis]